MNITRIITRFDPPGVIRIAAAIITDKGAIPGIYSSSKDVLHRCARTRKRSWGRRAPRSLKFELPNSCFVTEFVLSCSELHTTFENYDYKCVARVSWV